MKIITTNKRAYFEYEILEKYEAGIVLEGSEVKSLRDNGVSLNGSFIQINEGECWLKNAFIKNFDKSSVYVPSERKNRKLLLHKREIGKLYSQVCEKGMTLVPLKFYFDTRNRVKVEMGLGKGKKIYDKRESIKKKDLKREVEREFKTLV